MPARRRVALAIGTAVLIASTLATPTGRAEPPVTRPAGPAVAVDPAATTTGVDITLPEAVGIDGRVLTARGRPIDEASVSVFSATGHRLGRAASGSDGSFHVSGLPAADGYVVCVNHHGTALVRRAATGHLGRCVGSSGDYDGTAPSAGATAFHARSGTVVRNLQVRLPAGAAVSGRLLGAGTELGGLQIEVFDAAGRSIRSGPVDGAYQVLGLATGDYRICVGPATADGVYDSVTGERGTGYLGHCTTSVHLVAGTHRSGLDLHLPVAGAVRGTVLGDGDLPVRYSAVRVFRDRTLVTHARTGPGGGFDIGGLRTGRYQVCAHGGRAGRSPVRYDRPRCTAADVTAGSTTPDVTLRPQHRAQLFGAVTGTVRTRGGAPLRGIGVDIYDTHGRRRMATSTAADGTYLVRGLPIGDYVVCFARTAGGTPGRYGPSCSAGAAWNQADLPGDATPVLVGADQTVSGVDATLAGAGLITGTVTALGRPLAGETVWLFSASGNVIDWRWTDGSGRYTFGGLAAVPRGYRVCVSAPDPADESTVRSPPAPDCEAGATHKTPGGTRSPPYRTDYG